MRRTAGAAPHESAKLLLKFRAGLEVRDYLYDATALQLAIREGFDYVIPFLLDYGADVEVGGSEQSDEVFLFVATPLQNSRVFVHKHESVEPNIVVINHHYYSRIRLAILLLATNFQIPGEDYVLILFPY